MLIQVTQYEIDCGKRGSRCYCPIALALNKHFDESMVYKNEVVIKGSNRTYPLSDNEQIFIREFDKGNMVLPFSFEIDIKDEDFD